jgi:histidinol dehydrogenase
MSVGFGFSVGDFIAALELVATVVDALRESGEASKQYRGLVRQLDSLESVLLRVKRLELDESQHAEHVALQQAAAQCQRTIEDFWKKIKTYQPALSFKGTASRLKEGWMKIRWAVCKKEDINTFKADIAAHTDSIQLLLTTIQM